ncbi:MULTISPECIES: DeoD-type purine-nucleoside phosphorylase [unclassified Candidatus Frackibacter]|uniref:DeoD-type purine-nucleoside phosphorylase n=1 Tax=unclassified Candidatus Frackibacter TaxID=2648818 RepID=UPI0008801C01|nr:MULTISPECIES: DeoD-type purine-nucleoside phosphorylase [unclassified Candidatus Frackibacter]SDC68134.1 purine-nucleoside phosphorylase [Candidatus Frackibacter sp. WG11]SEM83513.1 purine-nucleoside phosphorylase [Candidatus Frackibacter sp. WG12]SFL91755.1 purine-nucleoside phosphorylase [Candidatus Frackibacter sp. WG13]
MPIHIEAEADQVADIVLLPGNPERATYMAEKFLDEPKVYTDYRKMYGYTGTFNGVEVSIQTTGMGVPSTAIILEELHMLGAKTLIRVGTCGALNEGLEAADLLIGQSAASVGTTINNLADDITLSPPADFELINNLYQSAVELEMPVHVGQIVTSDYFYGKDDTYTEGLKKLAEYGVLGVEMETAALYNIAAKYGLRAATVLTVSDHVFSQVRADKDKIKQGVDRMTEMVLDTVTKLYS